MAAVPLLEETSGGPSGTIIAGLAGLSGKPVDPAQIELLEGNRPLRRLARVRRQCLAPEPDVLQRR